MSKNSKPNPQDYTIQVTAPSAGLKKNSSFWYGGQVAYITYKGYKFYLEAAGDIRVSYIAKEGDSPEWFKDKNNAGQMQEWFKHIFEDDDQLYQAIGNSGTKKYPQLQMENNNWWECVVQDPSGEIHDLMWVLETDNYFEAIDEIIESMDDIIKQIGVPSKNSDN